MKELPRYPHPDNACRPIADCPIAYCPSNDSLLTWRETALAPIASGMAEIADCPLPNFPPNSNSLMKTYESIFRLIKI